MLAGKDIQSRQLRYFIAVAEELSFTRAAQKLYVAQQAMSAQIKQLEQSLGVTLLTRTTRSVALTAAGAAFYEDATATLAAMDAAVGRARLMQRTESTRLVLGFVEGAALTLTEPIMSAFRDRHPGATIEMRQFNYDDPSCGLNDGLVDVAFVRRPLTTDRVDFLRLFTQPLVALVRADHHLAERTSVRAADLIDEQLSGAASTDPVWNAFWELDEHRGGSPGRIVTRSTGLLEVYQKVMAGVCISVSVACARWIPHPGVKLLPITDVEHSEVTVAWPRDTDSPLVRSFVDVARRVRDEHPKLVTRLQEPDFKGRSGVTSSER
ncbi:LysR family transcriptional regulator [Rhodococcus maanshanensis]|uniref:DNA-binding transcriptional regulator, LysR family n=1 Tax=Rhodococcus maanshanensis TaxID=183556 RepID=A0A1H7P195_9NOCA|nr:LysR substrate-binding domain-containing protein [Rhodococcus maanshanensis]SEL29581.1 DNA-binding transcriptional regulator, LysR family [Rhodococcus maanshanensis]